MSAGADRNLLYGVLALQMDFVSREQLIEGMHAWVLEKETPLGDLLKRRNALDEDTAHLLDRLVQKHIEQHGNDPRRSLAAVAPGETLAGVADDEVQASLAALNRAAGSPTRTPPPGSLPRDPGEGRATTTRYRVLRPHAKGGLGQVSVALDMELNREIALKEIQEHYADHPEARARFIREAEITGNLEHPGIVPVYGLGTSADGRPYYAMRFIRGRSLHEAIEDYHSSDKSELGRRKLLNHFVAVCHAVAFAHSRGVIHRDLKPANVMLGEFGETLVVDWGLARMLTQEEDATAPPGWVRRSSGGGSTPTEAGQAVGTPNYMPPEQARGHLDQVGPTSDVFSLGATLYQILTGRAPYIGKDVLIQAAACAWQPARQIHREAPVALEVVCGRAMAAQPAQRYGSARELGEEVERWLADEPVLAHREPLIDRARRWGRKHRTLVSSAVAVLLVGVVGLSVGLGAVKAEQRNTAEALETAEENLEQAEANLALAKKAVNDTFDVAKNHRLLQQPGMHEVRKLLLEKALPFYKRFQIRRDDTRSRAELADQYFRIGYITWEIGNKSEARAAYARAEEIYCTLVKSNPAVTLYQDALAGTLNNMGLLLQEEGKRKEALKAYSQAHDIQHKLVEDNPAVTRYQNDLAGTLTNMGAVLQTEGKRTEALKAYRQACAIGEKLVKGNPAVTAYQNDLATTLTNMGVLLKAEGKRTEALKAYTRARDIGEKLVEGNPAVSAYQEDLARTLTNLGLLLKEEGKRKEALKASKQACDIFQKLVKNNPSVTRYQNDLAATLNNMGLLLQQQGKRAEALKAFRQAQDIREKLVKANPSVTQYRTDLARTCGARGLLLRQSGKATEALADFDESLKHLLLVRQRDPGSVDAKGLLFVGTYYRAVTLGQLKRHRDALPDWDRAIELAPASERLFLRMGRALCLARAGQYTRALREAEQLPKLGRLPAAWLYDLACVAALGGAAANGDLTRPLPWRERFAETAARQALAWLHGADNAGFFKAQANRAGMSKDTDLDSLRGRNDFKRLLETIDKPVP